MIYGLYLSAQGAQLESTRLDAVANNLANASTSGFKRDIAVFQAHAPFDVENGTTGDLPGNLNASTGGIAMADVATDFSDGPVVPTGGTYDLALSGPGFLRVSDGEREFLTRNGRLTVNNQGQLVTHETGLRVLSTGGSGITIPSDATNIEITVDGTLWGSDAAGRRTKIERLDLVRPESFDLLQKMGNSLYRTEASLQPAGAELQVRQGFLEASGTRPVGEMMEMIEASRAFETNINMIKFQDEALGQLLQSLGR